MVSLSLAHSCAAAPDNSWATEEEEEQPLVLRSVSRDNPLRIAGRPNTTTQPKKKRGVDDMPKKSSSAIKDMNGASLLKRTATPFGGERRLVGAGIVGPSMAGMWSLLPEQVHSFMRPKVDFVEVEGEPAISACSADWSWSFVQQDGTLCKQASVHFDVGNKKGEGCWFGAAACGAVVVAERNATTNLERVLRNAEEVGAVGLILVNDATPWDEDFELRLESLSFAGLYYTPPKLPAVLVPARYHEVLCSGRDDLRARLVRR